MMMMMMMVFLWIVGSPKRHVDQTVPDDTVMLLSNHRPSGPFFVHRKMMMKAWLGLARLGSSMSNGEESLLSSPLRGVIVCQRERD